MIREINNSIGPATWASIVFGLLWSGFSAIYTETGATVATVSLNLSLIVALFEHTARLSAERDRLGCLIAALDSPHLGQLGERLVDATAEALHAMVRPMRIFHSEAEFFSYACGTLSHLGPNDSIIVACADSLSRWMGCPFLRRWLMENASAAGRGVPFSRILLEVDAGLRPLAIEQASHGIRTILLSQSCVEALPEKCRLPRDMGIAVVNRERVYIHFGAGATFYGAFIESAMLAALVLSHLALLESNGEVISAMDTKHAA
jgi:hypothetical protein